MSDLETRQQKRASKRDAEKTLSVARTRLNTAIGAVSSSRINELDDQKFAAGNSDNNWQWPSEALSTRTDPNGGAARPTLTVNKLPQHIKQVTNDQRQNRPAGKVIPVNGDADIEMSEIYDGMVRHVEYISDADVAYDTACESQVTHGEGFWRIITDYLDEKSFDQDILIQRIMNPFSVYLDPMMQKPSGEDAQWGFIVEDITHDEFHDKYPDAAPVSSIDRGTGDGGLNNWINDKTVRVAEYFYYETTKETLNLYPDGSTAFEGSEEAARMEAMGMPVVKSRPSDRKKVCWLKTNGYEILEEGEWAGKYIPIIRVVGNEFLVDGERFVTGIVRNAKDPQRMYNYWPLALDTVVPTPQGWSTIGTLAVGDTVFDEKGNQCRVLAKSPVYTDKECFLITFDDGSTIVADGDHQWTVEQRGKRTGKTFTWTNETILTCELVPGDHFVGVTKPLKSASLLPLDPYFLGVWLGDGDTINPQITQSSDDVEPMRQLLIERGLDVGAARKTNTAYRFTVHGTRGILNNLGVLGHKHIPVEYLRASVNDRLELLRGLMDTDGSVSKTGQCSFTTAIPALRDGFAELVHSLGIKVAVCERKGQERLFPNGNMYNCADNWQFSFSLREDMSVFNLPRKKSARKSVYHPRRTNRFGIVSVERVDSVPVQCITVDNESHLFLVGESMIPTHNCSQEAEMLALAPKAPFIGYGGQFEGYEDKWKTANTVPWPYLEVNPEVTDGNGGVLPLPQRAMPPMAQQGLIAAKQGAAEDIKATTGQYNASLGMTSNERSGKAIMARQHEGDVGTYHYGDNLARAVRYSTRQIVDLIPKIYDTARIARIIGEDGEAKMVKVDPEQPTPVQEVKNKEGVTIEKIYNPSVGRYDVRVATGPGYATKRQQALDAMVELLQGNPELWAVAGDLFVKNMDWPGAQELAKRLGKAIDPKLLADEDNPELQQAKMQLEQVMQQYQQAQQMLQNVEKSFEAREMKVKEQELEIKRYEAETNRIKATQAGMSPEQIQDIVQGTLDAALHHGDIIGTVPAAPAPQEAPQVEMNAPMPQMPMEQAGMPPEPAPTQQEMM